VSCIYVAFLYTTEHSLVSFSWDYVFLTVNIFIYLRPKSDCGNEGKHICDIYSFASVIGTNCDAEVLKRNRTAGKNLDTHTIVAYGRKFNDSLITMIGRVIENYHVCSLIFSSVVSWLSSKSI
jgi:hypothetical protein